MGVTTGGGNMGLEALPSKKSKNIDSKLEGNGNSSSSLSNIFQLGQSQLLETTHAYWSDPCTSQNERKTYLDGIQQSYNGLLEEFINTADACVDQTNYLERVNEKWRWTVILGTGVVAIINILAANFVTNADSLTSVSGKTAIVFSVAAAVAAAILTVLANLENFANPQRRAHGFRQARERFLDASREYQQLWNTYVNPFYPRAEACINSIILLRMLVEKDRELRDRLVELTKIKGHET
jgi:hypothetical protein